MKILNLYSGIGGNRKLWGDEHDITAVENNSKIAKIYQDFFPKDELVITDAHQYLLEHFKEFDFIWSSPPCPTHSKIRKMFIKKNKDVELTNTDKDFQTTNIFLFFKFLFIGYVRP